MSVSVINNNQVPNKKHDSISKDLFSVFQSLQSLVCYILFSDVTPVTAAQEDKNK